ncbi:MAG: hypothetical protein AAF939_05175 [Planctomycetota bacterium]
MLRTIPFFCLLILSFLVQVGLGQTICPKNEILQFGNLFGYSTVVCKKDKDGQCATENSDLIFFYINRVNDMGCGFGKKCDGCKTNQVSIKPLSRTASYFAYQHNYNINRQNNINNGVFLDATSGISKTADFQFAKAGEDKAAKFFAIFQISVKYQLPGTDKIEYLTGPAALQLAVEPPVSEYLEATVEGANLRVTDGDASKDYGLILRDNANQVFLKSPLIQRTNKDPLPDPPKGEKIDISKTGASGPIPRQNYGGQPNNQRPLPTNQRPLPERRR